MENMGSTPSKERIAYDEEIRLAELQREYEEVERIKDQAFDDYASGKITKEQFDTAMKDYTDWIEKNLQEKIKLEEKIGKEDGVSSDEKQTGISKESESADSSSADGHETLYASAGADQQVHADVLEGISGSTEAPLSIADVAHGVAQALSDLF